MTGVSRGLLCQTRTNNNIAAVSWWLCCRWMLAFWEDVCRQLKNCGWVNVNIIMIERKKLCCFCIHVRSSESLFYLKKNRNGTYQSVNMESLAKMRDIARGAGAWAEPPQSEAQPPWAPTMKWHFVQGLWRAYIVSHSQVLLSPSAPLPGHSFWKVWLPPCYNSKFLSFEK